MHKSDKQTEKPFLNKKTTKSIKQKKTHSNCSNEKFEDMT